MTGVENIDTQYSAGGAINISNNVIDVGELFTFKWYTYQYGNLDARSGINVSGDMLKVSTPAGYTPFCFFNISTGNGYVVPASWSAGATGSGTVVSLRNIHNSSSTTNNPTLTVCIIYIKQGHGV